MILGKVLINERIKCIESDGPIIALESGRKIAILAYSTNGPGPVAEMESAKQDKPFVLDVEWQ